MKKIALLFALPAALLLFGCGEKNTYVEVSGFSQGVEFSVKFNTKALKVTPEKAVHLIDSILTCVDTTLSGFNPGSLMSRYNRGEKVVPNWLFKDIYNRAKEIYEYSNHTVDVTAAPLFDLWGFGFSIDSSKNPSEEEVAATRAVSGFENFSGDLSQAAPGQKLNFNAIAQGYTSDLVASFLYGIGATDMLVSIGEIYCDGKNPSGENWKIAIDAPIEGNNEPGAHIQGYWHSDGKPHGVVTSGNYRRFYVHDGKKLSHTIDPRTGRPVQHNLLSATVIADDSCMADAMSTACMVLGLEQAKDFLIENGLEGFLVYDEDGIFRTWCTPGFNVTY